MSDSIDVARSRYRALQQRARNDRRPTDELLVLYALEGFLMRLSQSARRDDLILKGGVLLAAFGARRPTRDVDLQATRTPNDVDSVRAIVADVLDLPAADGLQFNTTRISASIIREEGDYSGVRIAVDARLASARIRVRVDVNVDDPIWPEPADIDIPRLLDGGAVRLRGYPLHMIHAEKIVTAVARGQANTRWRDFADVYLLSGEHDVDGQLIQESVDVVAEHRGVQLAPLSDSLRGYGQREQSRWARWRAKHHLQPLVPDDFATVLDAVCAFADPVLIQFVDDRTWHADRRAWGPPAYSA
jgi:hypothetical protein